MSDGVRRLRATTTVAALFAAGFAFAATARADGAASAPAEVNLDVVHWQIIQRESGPIDYYRVVNERPMPFVRAEYRPPESTAVLGMQIPDVDRQATRLKWQWRAITLPAGGDECVDGKRDSAANVYATWKRGLRWYTLKYSWSAVGARGAVCDRKRTPFVAQDTILLESGGPTGVWRREDVDLRAEFRRHFEEGDPNAEVPDFVGVAILTDGDDTKSDSAADYADFVLVR